LSWEAPFADPSQWGGRRAEANEALAALLAQAEAAEELRSQFERHVETMIEPKLLERAKQAEARVTELEAVETAARAADAVLFEHMREWYGDREWPDLDDLRAALASVPPAGDSTEDKR